MNLPTFEQIMRAPLDDSTAEVLGYSRDRRAIIGYRIGTGKTLVSLLSGCHADEPVGPRFLSRLVGFLSNAPHDADVLTRLQWWIVPDINPDGAERNRGWAGGVHDSYDLAAYLKHYVREAPGDDIEFGFPRSEDDDFARPENNAVYNWWQNRPHPFSLHVSLHGMAFAGGPWFLIDRDWVDRTGGLRRECAAEVSRMKYKLHDVQRNGEKGFERIERGFCTRPDSASMSDYFLRRHQPDVAASFRPSSMETIRSFGGDALTLVSEVPLFVLPGVGERIEPVDAEAQAWADRIVTWRARALAGGDIEDDLTQGILPVPIDHQMRLQWTFVREGIRCVLMSDEREAR